MLRTLVIDSALPLVNGSPRQRAAEHLVRCLSMQSDVQQITLDVWSTEVADRGRVDSEQSIIASFRHRQLDPCLLARCAGQSGTPRASRPPSAALGALLTRYAVKSESAIREFCPDRIVLGDAMLAGLVPWARTHAVEVLVAHQPGASEWHRQTAARLNDGEESRWHEFVFRELDASDGLAKRLEPLPPMRFEFSDLFLSKSNNVIVPATGISWLDRRIVDALGAPGALRDGVYDHQADIILMGFKQSLAQRLPGANVQSGWQHLAGMTGAAKAVLIPWMAPHLVPFTNAALSVGTPVIADALDAPLFSLAGREGVIATPSGQFSEAMALLLDSTRIDRKVYAGISSVARERSQSVPPVPEPRTRRFDALIGRPKIMFNRLTNMLLVRLAYRASSQVDEVRLVDASGAEIDRLVPNEITLQQGRVELERAIILARERLGDGFSLEFYASEQIVQSVFVPIDDVADVEAELAFLEQDEVILRGGFWADADSAKGFGIGPISRMRAIPLSNAVPLNGLEGVAVPFEVALELQKSAPVPLWRSAEGADSIVCEMIQRCYVPGNAITARPRGVPSNIRRLHGRHQGSRAWILGNGPSVQMEDLARIPPGDVVFAFNRFYLSYDQHPVRETYVVSADSLMVQDFGQEMIDVASGLPLFCVKPRWAHGLEGDHVLLPQGDGNLPLFSMQPQRWVSVGGSSVFVALQMAHFMGIRNVVLYGMDYSFSMKLVRDPRYPFPVSYEEGNHFISGYRGDKPWCPPNWKDISAGFLNARVAFELTGGRVINATRGGRLEIFPREDFDSLI